MTTPQQLVDNFIAKTSARPLPTNPMARIKTLAKELAEGAVEGIWFPEIRLFRGEITGGYSEDNIRAYLEARWQNKSPRMRFLVNNNYMIENGDHLVLVKAAYDLLEEVEPANIFISYKRSESSAFALLVLARLKAEGLEPFIDLSLVPGENWQAGLQERIQKYDYLIALLGKETLKSEVCLQELTWALDAKLTIIPVWHNGFVYKADEWKLPVEIDRLLASTHSIRVKEESALDYNNAIVELLNRFGITP